MKRGELEAKLIRLRRTAAVDLKEAARLDERARKKRVNAARLQQDADDLQAKLAKLK